METVFVGTGNYENDKKIPPLQIDRNMFLWH